MLRALALRDFVIVDTLDLEFAGGFTALTGETGAGKSILVDALGLALGARADAGVVRPGAERADISARSSTWRDSRRRVPGSRPTTWRMATATPASCGARSTVPDVRAAS